MLDTPCSEVKCKTTGYSLHLHVSLLLPLLCITMCHHVSTELYLVYVLHWPDDDYFMDETCSPDVTDISSMWRYTYAVFSTVKYIYIWRKLRNKPATVHSDWTFGSVVGSHRLTSEPNIYRQDTDRAHVWGDDQCDYTVTDLITSLV